MYGFILRILSHTICLINFLFLKKYLQILVLLQTELVAFRATAQLSSRPPFTITLGISFPSFLHLFFFLGILSCYCEACPLTPF